MYASILFLFSPPNLGGLWAKFGGPETSQFWRDFPQLTHCQSVYLEIFAITWRISPDWKLEQDIVNRKRLCKPRSLPYISTEFGELHFGQQTEKNGTGVSTYSKSTFLVAHISGAQGRGPLQIPRLVILKRLKLEHRPKIW